MNTLEIQNLFHLQKRKSWEIRNLHIEHRLTFLKALHANILKYESEIHEAFLKDYKKPEFEVISTEVYPVLTEIKKFIGHLHQWTQPQNHSSGLLFPFMTSEVRPEPKGTCLIIAPWNYPFSLALTPLVGAIGAGNTVILKPSEFTPQVSQILEKIIEESFPPEIAKVIPGDKEVSQILLDFPFDHIFFTGSTQVGKIVMTKAAQHLSSVTLELGGKSPTVIHESADLNLAAEKIIWGKILNNGQTCVAPDYVLIPEGKLENFINSCKTFLEKIQDHQPCQLISKKHEDRIQDLESDALRCGAKLLLKNKISFIHMTNSSLNSRLMKEEIFGPLLPIVTYSSHQEMIHFITDRPKPLALYVFSCDKTFTNEVLRMTASGGVCVNDTVVHVGNHHLPFGGIGESGMGSYHGQNSFLTFSHLKPVMKQGLFPRLSHRFYPPYKDHHSKLFRLLIKLGF